ncbi:MAG TPA: iron-containing redox enzyme family protein, partial [Solirubrobacteraceae bacterium]|nr:iron-containing redox enzyme family protein [Solirubrobacteraceae bacterium]
SVHSSAAGGTRLAVLALPQPRGEISKALMSALTQPVHPLQAPALAVPADALSDQDLQLSLYLCYELHYRGLPGIADEWEWEPTLLALRRELEAAFEAALAAAVPRPPAPDVPEEMDLALRAVAEADDGPSLSRYIERDATAEQVLEFVTHRSAYQLKEADPHSWVLPRLYGAPKAALVQIQVDEYGNGEADRIHAQLFAEAMDELGLDARYGAYIEHLTGVTLATVNLMSLFGLHRRWRGAIVGHLAVFEMESSVPNRRYASGLRRLGYGERATAFFDEHVTADAIHENIAAVDLAGGLARQQPELARDVLWGAATLVELDANFARHLLGAWEEGVSSLRLRLPAGTGAARSAAA